MLRRHANSAMTARAALALRGYHATSLRNNKTQQQQAEDQAELERERALREKFAQKIGGFTGAFNNATSGSTAGASQSCSQQSCGNKGPNAGATGNNFMRIFFFVSSIYMMTLIAQLENPNSAISMFQGLKWWQAPTDAVAYLTLMRVILPFREQNRIRTEYEEAQKRDPNLTLPFFFQTRYPTHFQGSQVSQQQVVTAIAVCLATSRDIGIVTTLQRAVGMARDQRVAIDSIMDTLYKQYPHVFAAPPQPIQ